MNDTRRLPVLMYHQVLTAAEQEQASRRTNPAYTVSLDCFRGQMGYLADNGYCTLTLDEVFTGIAAQTKAVVITFDDGWADNWSTALPVMNEYGVRATVFVISGFVGMPGYMTWEHLRDMSSSGISIQSHTVSHRPLGTLAKEEIFRELAESKDVLEQRLGRRVDYVSMPQGLFSPLVLHVAQEAGYRGVCTSEPGVCQRDGMLQVFSRINIDGSMDLAGFSRIVGMDTWTIRQLAVKKGMKNLLKGLVGYERYRRLYQLRYKIDLATINR